MDSLQLVHILLEVGFPDYGSVLEEQADKSWVCSSFAGYGAVPEVPVKEYQGAVCSLCDDADVVGLFKVVSGIPR